jgi:hypothetical protein
MSAVWLEQEASKFRALVSPLLDDDETDCNNRRLQTPSEVLALQSSEILQFRT